MCVCAALSHGRIERVIPRAVQFFWETLAGVVAAERRRSSLTGKIYFCGAIDLPSHWDYIQIVSEDTKGDVTMNNQYFGMNHKTQQGVIVEALNFQDARERVASILQMEGVVLGVTPRPRPAFDRFPDAVIGQPFTIPARA